MKHSKVANLLSDDRRKSAIMKDKSRRGSRESLDMAYEGEEVSAFLDYVDCVEENKKYIVEEELLKTWNNIICILEMFHTDYFFVLVFYCFSFKIILLSHLQIR